MAVFMVFWGLIMFFLLLYILFYGHDHILDFLNLRLFTIFSLRIPRAHLKRFMP
jgi:hypothetical protein